MAKDTADLENLIAFARANGLKSLKFKGIEFEFSAQQSPPPLANPDTLASLLNAADKEAEMPGDDEMLYASSPYFDELRAQREAAQAPEPKEN